MGWNDKMITFQIRKVKRSPSLPHVLQNHFSGAGRESTSVFAVTPADDRVKQERGSNSWLCTQSDTAASITRCGASISLSFHQAAGNFLHQVESEACTPRALVKNDCLTEKKWKAHGERESDGGQREGMQRGAVKCGLELWKLMCLHTVDSIRTVLLPNRMDLWRQAQLCHLAPNTLLPCRVHTFNKIAERDTFHLLLSTWAPWQCTYNLTFTHFSFDYPTYSKIFTHGPTVLSAPCFRTPKGRCKYLNSAPAAW